MKPKIILFLSILAIIFSGCKQNKGEEKTPDTLLFDATRWVRPVKEEVVHELRCYGDLEFDQNKVVPVYAPLSGVATEVFVETGNRVNKGDALAIFQSSMITDLQREEVDARSDLELANRNAELTKKMFADGFASQKETLEADKNVEKAAANLKRIEELLKLYGANSSSSYILRAPKSGYVVQRSVNPGMVVRDNFESALFVISEINTIWAVAHLYQSDVGIIEKGDEAEMYIAGINDTIKGKVSRITNFIDKASKSLQVVIELNNFDERLKPGMFAEISLLSKDERQVLPAIPTEAIVFCDNKNYVTLIDNNDKPLLREVKLGLQYGKTTYITEGISDTDRVVDHLPLLIFQKLYDEQKKDAL